MVSPEQPVAATEAPVNNVDTAAYEQQIQTLQQRAVEAEEKFQGIKGKLDDVYKRQDEQRRKTLEDKGQWKDLWEEANSATCRVCAIATCPSRREPSILGEEL